MSDELPQGWTSANIADVTQHVANVRPEISPEKDFGYVDISSIDNSSFSIKEVKQFKGKNAPSRARRPIRPNDVIFSNVRTYLRNVALVGPDCAAQLCSTGFTVLRPNALIEARYLFRYVLTNDFIDRVTPQQTGTHYPATSDRVVMAEQIALPPLAEQRRIVAKMEKLLGQVNACQHRLAKIPVLLKRFRQSVLAAACSGRLTADWREENPEIKTANELLRSFPIESEKTNRRAGRLWGAGEVPELTEEELDSLPPTWTWAKVQDLGHDPHDAVQVGPMSMKSRDFANAGVPVLNVGCIQWNGFDESKLDYMPKEKAQAFSRYRICTDDILFTRSGTVGRCALATHRQDGWLMTFHLLRVRPNPRKCLPKYLLSVFRGSPNVLRQATAAAIGSTRAGFNTRLLAELGVPLPPFREQEEIVRRVEKLFTLADQLEARFAEGQKRVDSITQAILAKAFRGELVPTEYELAKAEGRAFESVEELLERIKTDGKPRTDGKRRKSRGNKRSVAVP